MSAGIQWVGTRSQYARRVAIVRLLGPACDPDIVAYAREKLRESDPFGHEVRHMLAHVGDVVEHRAEVHFYVD